MKKVISAFIVLMSTVALGATTTPVQLLNPTGSGSGQAIVSTGPSTPPTWGGIGLNGIVAIPSNTVLTNATSSSAAPTAFSMPSCSTTQSALQWVSGSGFSCGNSIDASTLTGRSIGTSGAAVPLLNGANTWSSAQTFSSGIVGATNGVAAAAGIVGQVPSPTNLSNVALTSDTPANVSSATLTAGDYDVTCTARFAPNASTTWGNAIIGVSTVSATRGPAGTETVIQAALSTGLSQSLTSPAVQILGSASQTVYCVAQANFGTSTMTASGFMHVRRLR